MITVQNPNPEELSAPIYAFRYEAMIVWCESNCLGEWEILDIDTASFERTKDADRFVEFFWDLSVKFDI